MSQIAHSVRGDAVIDEDANALNGRIIRVMTISMILAVVISALAASWRITSGVFLGGSLSILNYRWLHTSVAAIFNIDFGSQKPHAGVSRYVLRYLLVGALVLAAVNLQIVSLAATLAGLCAFVPALFAEAGREFYFAIIHREESL